MISTPQNAMTNHMPVNSLTKNTKGNTQLSRQSSVFQKIVSAPKEAAEKSATKSSNVNQHSSRNNIMTLSGGVTIEGYDSLNEKQKENLGKEVEKYKAKILASIRDGSFDKVITQSFRKQDQNGKDIGANLDDKAGLEALKQAALNGDWGKVIPKIKIGSANELGSAQDSKGYNLKSAGLTVGGAFISGSTKYGGIEAGTIILNKELLNIPSASSSSGMNFQSILTEETAHAWDVRLNTVDSKGDEGEALSIFFDRSKVDDRSLKRLLVDMDSTSKMLNDVTKALNQIDHGTMVIDGKITEVEFGFGSWLKKGIKAVKKVAGKVFDTVKKVGKKVIELHKKAFRAIKSKLLESKWFNALISVLSFVPIPGIQQLAWVAQMAISANNVVQGLEDGDLRRAAMGAVSGLSGVPATSSFGSTASTIVTTAKTGLQIDSAIRAIEKGDVTGLLMSGASAAGGAGYIDPNVVTTMHRIGGAIQAVKNNDASRVFALALEYGKKSGVISKSVAQEAYNAYVIRDIFINKDITAWMQTLEQSGYLNEKTASVFKTLNTVQNIIKNKDANEGMKALAESGYLDAKISSALKAAAVIQRIIESEDVSARMRILEESGHLNAKIVSAMKTSHRMFPELTDKQWGVILSKIASNSFANKDMASNPGFLDFLYKAREESDFLHRHEEMHFS